MLRNTWEPEAEGQGFGGRWQCMEEVVGALDGDVDKAGTRQRRAGKGAHHNLAARQCDIRRSTASRLQLPVQPFECRSCAIIDPQAQDELASMLNEACSFVDHFLQHRLDAPALGRVTYGRILAGQTTLADQTQDVHRQRSQLAHQVVRVELARGQPSEIQVAFELACECHGRRTAR